MSSFSNTASDWATNWFSTSSLSDITRNPYASDRDVGGSSSGTASSIAADLAILGLGEDTGGSIRLPASFCGLVGLRPTVGMISRYGMSPLVVPQDTPGPMCRTVRDAAIMMDVLVGFDENDNYTTANLIAGEPRGGSYAAGLDAAKPENLRIGVLTELFGDDADPEMSPINKCVRGALATLRSHGAKVIDITIPNLKQYFISTSLYQTRAQNDIDTFFKTTTHSPSLRDLSVQSIFSDPSAWHERLDLFKLIASSPHNPHDDPDYAEKMLAQEEFRRVILVTMATTEVDLLAFPSCKIGAPKTADVLRGRWGIYDFPTNTLLASQAVLPAVGVCVGMTEGEVRLPVGLELVGVPYSEQGLLEAGAVVERVVGGRISPALS